MPCPSEFLRENVVGRLDWYNVLSDLPPHLVTMLERWVSRVVRLRRSKPNIAMEMVMTAFGFNMQLGVSFCYALYRRRVRTGELTLPCDPIMVECLGPDLEVYVTPLEWGVKFVYIKHGEEVRHCSFLALGHHTCL